VRVAFIKLITSDKHGAHRKEFPKNTSFAKVCVVVGRDVGAGHCLHRASTWGAIFIGPVSLWWSWLFGKGDPMDGAHGRSWIDLEFPKKLFFVGWPISGMYSLTAHNGSVFVAE
jgi:hypothetical protein